MKELVKIINEGGNVFNNTSDVAKSEVQNIVSIVKVALPTDLQKHIITDIGSAGYKIVSGDIDVFIDEDSLLAHYGTDDIKSAKVSLSQYLQSKGFQTKLIGRNVHVNVPYQSENKMLYAQVDIMAIKNAAKVADWHQHGPRGSYEDPGFKANHLYILLNSIGKFLGFKIDAFAGTVNRRDNNEVVADNRRAAAKLLLNPKAKAADLNSVAAVLKALENDPDKKGKLLQARQDQAKGIITMPEDSLPGTAAWFRTFSSKF